MTGGVDFVLPAGAEAAAPPTVRDAVRLMVAEPDRIGHHGFAEFASFLEPGDLVVVNTSGTLAAEVDARRSDGRAAVIHLSSVLDDGDWVVEVRPPGNAHGPVDDLRAGETIMLPDLVAAVVHEPRPAGQSRLWRASVDLEVAPAEYLAAHGRPIRYSYVPRPHPLEQYQTVFAREAGSAEMPSAGRPFTDRIVTDLVTRGVGVAPVLLHTGVSSQDVGEPPQPEWFRVPAATARLVTSTRRHGGRVVAVGTTVTRALESAADEDGALHAASGWTDVVLGPERPARVVTGLVTGWHAPGASHLRLLQAVAGHDLVSAAYDAAVRSRYLWHEFGDSCLLLP